MFISISKYAKICFSICLLLAACKSSTVEASSQVSSASTPPNLALNAQTSPTKSAPHPIFSSFLPKLKAISRIPVHLPAYIPELDSSNPVYARLETVTLSKYQIMLAFTKDCTGGTACRLGSVSGEAITSKTRPLKGKTVALANRITGYFVDATCGANCSDAELTWEQNNGRYTVAIKAGKLGTLVKMANSAIAISPLNKPTTLKQRSSDIPDKQTISAEGIGSAKLGMTFGQMKQVLGSDTELKVVSPLMVDIDEIAVSQAGKVQYYILYPAGKKFTNSNRIEELLSDNPNFRTAEGVGLGTKLKQAEAIYGDATLFYNTSDESREYVRFANQPTENLLFRTSSPEQVFAGIYPSSSGEYNETKKFHESALIRSVLVTRYLSN